MPLQYQQHVTLSHSEGHSSGVTCLEFSPSGSLVASGSMDGRVCVWEVDRGKLLYAFSGRSAVLCLLWIPPTDNCMICGMEDGTLASLTISEVCCALFQSPHLTLLVQGVISVEGFWAHKYPVEHLAFNGAQLASGAHKEVAVWSQLETREFRPLCTRTRLSSPRTKGLGRRWPKSGGLLKALLTGI